MSDKFDIAVLGGGPGGYIAAIRAAQLGAKVALVEKDKLGGTCLNKGCIPTKALIACTNLYLKMQGADKFGISAENISIDFKKVVERKDRIIEKLVKGVEFLLKKNGVEIIWGKGKVLGEGQIEVETVESRKLKVESRKIILATGSTPICLPGLSFDKEKFLCSDDLLEYHPLPAQLDIVGGGVIGLHFAQIYSALGCKITIFEALPEILPGIDEEVTAKVKSKLKRMNVEIKTGVRFNPSQSCGKTLICIGRAPSIPGLTVNEKLETQMPGVYAVGDLISRKMFAHVAYEQGVIAAENALGGNRTFSYDNIPYGIYTDPEVGSIGSTEKEAREKHKNIKVGKFPFAALGIAAALGEAEGFVKVISDEAGKLLGVHILGPEATTLIGAATTAIKNGLSVEKLAGTWQSHPSFPEGLQEAALAALKRSLHSIN
ncbi:MAG: FAD-dependent oxidoreductase [Candidatus Margulisiibacteriota bacterium]